MCFCTLIGTGMSEGLEGVTVLAWGAQVPDTLASVAMAKKGMGAVGRPYRNQGSILWSSIGRVGNFFACIARSRRARLQTQLALRLSTFLSGWDCHTPSLVRTDSFSSCILCSSLTWPFGQAQSSTSQLAIYHQSTTLLAAT